MSGELSFKWAREQLAPIIRSFLGARTSYDDEERPLTADQEMPEDDARDVAARALLQLIGKGPGTTFPFPNQAHQDALYAVDCITKAVTDEAS